MKRKRPRTDIAPIESNVAPYGSHVPFDFTESELMVACPTCGSEYAHLADGPAERCTNSPAKYGAWRIPLYCEQYPSHTFFLYVGAHKGNVFVWTDRRNCDTRQRRRTEDELDRDDKRQCQHLNDGFASVASRSPLK